MAGPDLSVFERNRGFSDYQRANDEFMQRKALQQAQIAESNAQIKKAAMPDYDEIGKGAFIKAATQGVESLTPVEKAALLQADSKQQTYAFNPVTGAIEPRPSMLDRAGIQLGNILQPVQNNTVATPITPPNIPSQSSNNIGQTSVMTKPQQDSALISLYGNEPAQPVILSSPPNAPFFNTSQSPKSGQKLAETNIDSGRKRVDELIASASSANAAKQAASTMAALLPDMGYTGTGAGVTSGLDKALTGVGLPNVIAGKPSARETFESQGVEAWVRAVEPLKGALTQQEGARFDKAVSNLTTTPEGIKARARLTEALANRAQEKSNFYEQYFAQNGTLTGADKIWSDWSEKNPAITDELLGVAPQRITATNANGQKIELINGQWVAVQ